LLRELNNDNGINYFRDCSFSRLFLMHMVLIFLIVYFNILFLMWYLFSPSL